MDKLRLTDAVRTPQTAVDERTLRLQQASTAIVRVGQADPMEDIKRCATLPKQKHATSLVDHAAAAAARSLPHMRPRASHAFKIRGVAALSTVR